MTHVRAEMYGQTAWNLTAIVASDWNRNAHGFVLLTGQYNIYSTACTITFIRDGEATWMMIASISVRNAWL